MAFGEEWTMFYYLLTDSELCVFISYIYKSKMVFVSDPYRYVRA